MSATIHSTGPVLAIVGRPNVGKSTLFNRIAGRRIAIVHEQAGVTRDRVSARARWGDRVFEVMDTGGIAFGPTEKTDDVLGAATTQQAEVAIELADAIVMVVDVTTGIAPLDLEIAARLRASGKPVTLAVNKVDNRRRAAGADEFSALGFAETFPVAAVHGDGVAALLDAATGRFPAGVAGEEPPALRVAIVGRPNAGKSSLINAILQSDRTIVSEIPGTTRDSVDVPFTLVRGEQEISYVLVDTAGLKHRSKIKTSVDQFGLMRAERSIRECDLAVLTMDATAGVTKQDKRIGGLIAEAGRGCVILVNKWDLAAAFTTAAPAARKKKKNAPPTFQQEYEQAVRRELFFLEYAPILFGSAKTGQRLDQLFELLADVERAMDHRVDTPRLNQVIGAAMDAYAPPLIHGKRLRVYYAFQRGTRPPTFVLFVNDRRCLTPHYERYLVRQLRQAWGFDGCPVRLELRARKRR